jgi:hypothetical protein
MGMGSMHVSAPERRDRLWLICALSVVLLTGLGAAGEALGYDRYLKSDTTRRLTHSLLRQGTMLRSRQVWMRETNVSEPLQKHRNS